jgi:amidohydrolase
MIDYLAEAQAMRDELVARRRDFHMHPELAFEEHRTSGIVAEALNELGLEVQTGIGQTGVVAILDGAKDGPTVLVRADMDALPILEENAIEYVSGTPGVMHACGHDGHTAIGLGVARLLHQHRDQLAGRVKFVFQPAEEIGGGALAMIKDGALESPRPDVSLGLHLWNSMPVGQVGVADGPTMAGSSDFKIVITGRGGHGAVPDSTIDPVVCAAQMVTAFQTIVARNVSPLETGVVTVATIHGGHAHNVIPGSVDLTGTLRAFTIPVRDLIARRMEEIANGIAQAMNCDVTIQIRHLTIPLANHADVGAKVRPAVAQLVGEQGLNFEARTMGGEDMSYFMDDIPGMYLFVGSANAERGLDYAHHHPRFDFDEDALPLGVALLSAAIGEYVFPSQS